MLTPTGVSVGGQLVGTILFIIENSRPDKRGLYGSISMATATAGTLFGSIFVAIVELTVGSRDNLDSHWVEDTFPF